MMNQEFAIIVVIGGGYLVLHFVSYVLILRDRAAFQNEGGIFIYHFISAMVFSVGCLVAGVSYFSDPAMAVAIGLIALHGIYSVSFLELWSLAQGGYSISILTGVALQGTLPRSALVNAYASIGDAKKDDRLSVLSKSSLARRDGDRWHLLARGRVLAYALKALLQLVAIKRSG